MNAEILKSPKRLFTLFLALVMAFSIIPLGLGSVTAFAEESETEQSDGRNWSRGDALEAGIGWKMWTSYETGKTYPAFCLDYGYKNPTADTSIPIIEMDRVIPNKLKVMQIAAAATKMGAANDALIYVTAQILIWDTIGDIETREAELGITYWEPTCKKYIYQADGSYTPMAQSILDRANTINVIFTALLKSYYTYCKNDAAATMQGFIVIVADGEETEASPLVFPSFTIEAQKYDAEGGFDNDTSTGRGDASLDAEIEMTIQNDVGTNFKTTSFTLGADGKLASWTFQPWKVETDLTQEGDTYTGTATLTVKETPPAGYKNEQHSDSRNIITGTDTPAGTGTSVRTYTITYKATVVGTDVQYEIEVDGIPLDTSSLSSDTVYDLKDIDVRAEFRNQVKKANLQLVKLKSDDLDPFTDPNGSWNSGKHPMVNSYWSMKLISGGSEGSPYVHAVKITNNDSGYNVYVQDATYVITNDGSGTIMDGSDDEHSFITNEYGQLYIYNIPYGKYEMKETKAENDGYVLETVYIDVQEKQDGGNGEAIIITSSTTTVGNGMFTVLVTDDVKKNEIQIVKVDSETGKTIPMANTTFRIRYMGREGLVGEDGYEYDDANIGRLLQNGSVIAGDSQSGISSDKYLFLTDFNGKVTLPYELEYGNYQIEEICAPEGYYVGTYDETGTGSSVEGDKGYYDTVVIYDSNGNKVDFYERDSEGNIVYDDNGNPVTKTDTDNASKLIFNIYPFSVTEQNKDETVIKIVNMADNAVKGKVEIYKTGETLVGFKKTTDEKGRTVYTPVYEQTPLGGATFDIFSAEDVTLNDSVAPPDAYKRSDGSLIETELIEFNHSEFPNAVRVERKVLEDGSTLEYITEAEQETLENQNDVMNMSYATLSTATQKGTSYVLEYSGEDENGNAVSYVFDFKLEYAAGGWNYSEVHITKHTEFASVEAVDTMALPEIFNGSTPIEYATAVYENGNRSELLSDIVNEGKLDTAIVEPVVPKEHAVRNPVVPVMKDTTYSNEPVYTAGYVRSDFDMSVYIQTNGTKAEDEIAIADANGAFQNWMIYTDYLQAVKDAEAAGTPEVAPVAVQAVSIPGYEFLNIPTIPDGYKLTSPIGDCYNITNGTSAMQAVANDDGSFKEWVLVTDITDDVELVNPIVSDAANLPEIPAGATEIIIHPQSFEAVIDGVLCTYMSDDETGENVWAMAETILPETPDGYTLEYSFPKFVAKSETEEKFMLYVIDHTDNDTEKWIPCNAAGEVFTSWTQEVNINLVQHNESEDGWTVKFDGFVFKNVAKNEEVANATFINPFEDATPVISDGVGCIVSTDGNITKIDVPHPTDTTYFKLIDGVEVSVVYLGGYTKTIIRVPDGAKLPEIYDKNGKRLDLLNADTNSPVSPDYPVHEIVGENGEYVRTTYDETVSKDENGHLNISSSYIIEVVSAAHASKDSYRVNYYDGHTSMALVLTNVETGAEYGKLFVLAEGKTMRYPLGKLVETITSNDKGIAVSSELPLGTYYIREASAPSGYVTSTGTYEFTLSYQGQYIPLVWTSQSIENAAMDVQLDLYKVFQASNGSTKFEPKSGAVFGIFANSDITAGATAADEKNIDVTTIKAGDLLYTVTTDKAGRVLETVRLPKGDYYVQEIATLNGYELDDTKYLFRVDEESPSGALQFDYELNGIYGKIVQTGKETANIEITTQYQVPSPILKVNGTEYDVLNEELSGNVSDANQEDGFAVESGYLAKNVIDEDRSTFTIGATKDTPITIEFANGAKLEVTVENEKYTAVFTDGTVDASNSGVVLHADSPNFSVEEKEDGTKTVSYSPIVAYTGYTVETDTNYQKPDTRLVLNNGVTASLTYDPVASAKKVVVKYPAGIDSIEGTITNPSNPDDGGSSGNKPVDPDNPGESGGSGNEGGTTPGGSGSGEEKPGGGSSSKPGGGETEPDAQIPEVGRELMAALNSEAEAIALAQQYGITFVDFGDGVATFTPADGNTDTASLNAIIKKGEDNGWTPIFINFTISAVDPVDPPKGGDTDNTNENKPTDTTDVVAGRELIAAVDSEAKAIALAEQYGITFVDYGNGIASFTPADGKTDIASLNAIIKKGKDNGWTLLELNITIDVDDNDAPGGDAEETTSTVLLLNGSADIPAGITVNQENRTITIDPSVFSGSSLKMTFGENGETLTMSRENGALIISSPTAKAVNATSGEEVKDGYQADTLRVGVTEDGQKAVVMENRTITLESAFARTSVDVELAYGQEYATIIVNGVINGSWEDGAPSASVLDNKFVLNRGKAVTLLMNDGATYSLEITDNGILTADVQAITSGGFTVGNGAPVVKLNGSADNLIDANDEIIVQAYPLVASTKDGIGLDLSKTVTYARNDSAVSQIEVKINSRDDNLAVEPIKNYKKPNTPDKPEIPTGEKLCVSKVDVSTGKPIKGATLMVKDSAGNIIANGPTDSNGKLYFDNPGQGTFYLTETIAPSGYGLNTQTYKFTIDANGKISGKTTVPDGNDDGKVYIRKEDTTTAAGVAGAEIEVTNKKTGEVIFKGKSNESGYVSFEKPAEGVYEFRETIAPDGYFINETVYEFTVHPNGTITGDNTITDIPNTITITKTDYSTGKALKGATIEVYDENNVLVKVGVTDEDGKLYVAIPDYGTFHYKESVAPEGYILDEGTYTITINRDGTITGELKFTNEAIVPQTGIEDWIPIALGVIGFAALAYIGLTIISNRKKMKL